MVRRTRRNLGSFAVCLAVACLAGCGGGASGDVVAQVGGSTITKGELNHWMSTLAGGDFYEVAKAHTVPAGLVSEPANYGACVAHLEAIAAISDAGPARPTAAQLLKKCRELQQGLKLQALNFLVQSRWLIGLYGEAGLKATDAEAMQLLKRVKAEQFPDEKLQQYLARRRRSLSDELFVMKLNVLQQKVTQKLNAGGQQALAAFAEAGQRWTAKTSCRAGYVVQHCKQYSGQPTSALPSPAVLLEQIAVITGRPCINRPACANSGG